MFNPDVLKMNVNRFCFACMAAFLLSWGGCCEPCRPESLGIFYIKPGSETWLQAVTTQTLIFKSSQGRETTFDYSPKDTGLLEQNEECENVRSCGPCCKYSYSFAFLTTDLVSANRDMSFEIAILKDFRQYSPLQNSATVRDYLTITFNKQLTAELSALPDTLLSQNATVNGKTFANVFAYEVSNPGGTSKTPVALYFTKAQGIVGFKFADGEEWSLEL